MTDDRFFYPWQSIYCDLVYYKGRRKKNGYFTVRLTVRGVGITTPSLTVRKCENFDLFPLGTKHISFHCEGGEKSDEW